MRGKIKAFFALLIAALIIVLSACSGEKGQNEETGDPDQQQAQNETARPTDEPSSDTTIKPTEGPTAEPRSQLDPTVIVIGEPMPIPGEVLFEPSLLDFYSEYHWPKNGNIYSASCEALHYPYAADFLYLGHNLEYYRRDPVFAEFNSGMREWIMDTYIPLRIEMSESAANGDAESAAWLALSPRELFFGEWSEDRSEAEIAAYNKAAEDYFAAREAFIDRASIDPPQIAPRQMLEAEAERLNNTLGLYIHRRFVFRRNDGELVTTIYGTPTLEELCRLEADPCWSYSIGYAPQMGVSDSGA